MHEFLTAPEFVSIVSGALGGALMVFLIKGLNALKTAILKSKTTLDDEAILPIVLKVLAVLEAKKVV